MLSRTDETGIAAEFRSVRGDPLAELTRIGEETRADAVADYFGWRRWGLTSPTRSTRTRRSAKRHCPSRCSKRSRYRPLAMGCRGRPGRACSTVKYAREGAV